MKDPIVEMAWRNMAQHDDFKVIITDIVYGICGHMVPTTDPEIRARQQVGFEILRRWLISADEGSFPFDYISALTRLKLDQPDPDPVPVKEPAVKRVGWLGRLLGRTFHV